MDKLTIINGKRIEIIIDKYKCIIGNDYVTMDLIKNTLFSYFNKLGSSEYAKENNKNCAVLLNDEILNIKDFDFYLVTSNFDMDNDIKLGTKSLCLSYLSALLDNVEYDESFQTISILLNDIFDGVFASCEEDKIKPCFNVDFTKKELIKLLSFGFCKDDCVINNYDLSLSERIDMQLNMIDKIIRKTDKNAILYVDIPYISKEEFDIIKRIDCIKMIVFEATDYTDISDILLINKDGWIDTLNDEEVFNLCNNYNSHITIKEMKEKIICDHLNKRII